MSGRVRALGKFVANLDFSSPAAAAAALTAGGQAKKRVQRDALRTQLASLSHDALANGHFLVPPAIAYDKAILTPAEYHQARQRAIQEMGPEAWRNMVAMAAAHVEADEADAGAASSSGGARVMTLEEVEERTRAIMESDVAIVLAAMEHAGEEQRVPSLMEPARGGPSEDR